jgi:hypothetical protein
VCASGRVDLINGRKVGQVGRMITKECNGRKANRITNDKRE